jgi:hypothetical protein
MAAMFGYSRLFRSRWSALLWAAGILYMAYSFAGSQPADDNAADADAAQTAALANVF